ncbi:MAG TPA: cytochrome c oxidase subunit II [Caulobacteraceae bacterium]|nr:cytochrome c oxidase subunit II [Caulobacteraceae bacterium]
MQGRYSSIGRLAGATAIAALAAGWGPGAFAADTMGQPTNGAIDFQPAATQLRQQAMDFHNYLLLPILVGICALVLGLLLWCVIRYNSRANPTPARFTHNTMVEVIWTVGPVLILLVIAIFSFRLLFDYHDMPTPYMTVKATGYQWYWGYAYPDQKIPEQISSLATPEQAAADGVQYKLSATNPMVAPVNKVVRVLVTGADVIHSFSVNAFGIKIDAIPGRVNETWFKADRIGTFTGQCSQLCGLDHAFMPIEVKVLSQKDFDAWVASKAPKPALTAASAPATAPAPGASPTTALAQPLAAAVAKP